MGHLPITRLVDGAYPTRRAVVRLDATGQVQFLYQDASALQLSSSNSAGAFDGFVISGTISNPIRAATAFGVNDFRLAVNGILSEPDTTVIGATNFTTLKIGSIGGSQFINGHIKRIRLWNRKLTNAELQAETA